MISQCHPLQWAHRERLQCIYRNIENKINHDISQYGGLLKSNKKYKYNLYRRLRLFILVNNCNIGQKNCNFNFSDIGAAPGDWLEGCGNGNTGNWFSSLQHCYIKTVIGISKGCPPTSFVMCMHNSMCPTVDVLLYCGWNTLLLM